ncbi:MAG: dephospho-CoA kinase [Tepidisphaeraceae bacterium]
MPFHDKPILGMIGGIGAGKSFVSQLLARLGCCVIDSDQAARDAFTDPAVIVELKQLFGDHIVRDDGKVDRKLVALSVFTSPALREKLEAIIHPIVDQKRDEQMKAHANDPAVKVFVWDSPLLFEAGLADACDALLFVDAPRELRVKRVMATRGWDDAELARREAAQVPLDDKRHRADWVLRSDAPEANLVPQLKRIVEELLQRPLKTKPATPKR